MSTLTGLRPCLSTMQHLATATVQIFFSNFDIPRKIVSDTMRLSLQHSPSNYEYNGTDPLPCCIQWDSRACNKGAINRWFLQHHATDQQTGRILLIHWNNPYADTGMRPNELFLHLRIKSCTLNSPNIIAIIMQWSINAINRNRTWWD